MEVIIQPPDGNSGGDQSILAKEAVLLPLLQLLLPQGMLLHLL
jgi:hypothetical protein